MPSISRVSRGKAALAAVAGAGLAATSLATLSSPAHAAPVTVSIVAVNDFHGRIDTNTTKWATTIEDVRASRGDANTVVVSGGDNIGASLFASAYAEDEPTVEVFNAMDVGATAAGNHEFDRGFDWLRTNLIDGTNPDYTPADWAILGDNVFDGASGDPAMEESYRTTAAGLDVCVAGGVTEDTPSLVNPSGIAELEFGDPVAEVNRVVAEMEAADSCDVTVATYHEGAPDGSKSLQQNLDASERFRSIVNETSPLVDVIVTGHTHQKYAFDAPVPGTSGTRPVIQTGQYGEHVGLIDLTVDGGQVTAYTQTNVARSATANLAYPRVQEVKQITDAAIAAADVIGNKAVGSVTDDITTAFSGGTYGPDGYTGGKRDDRASESTLGHLVADALRETPIAGQPTPDLGLTNPGGLRDELFYAGNTATSPENTDGVVTFEEANAVLPFVNNVSYVELSGASLERVLEQQWQTNADGTIPSRPYLALGLSENVHVTVDPDAPLGQHVRTVEIDGSPLDADRTYTVATFSFLASGGDNFRAFREGVATDTGKVDRDLWIDGFLADGTAKSPDFTRRQVHTDAPTFLAEKQHASFRVEKVDLTSLGTPANQAVQVTMTKPDGTVKNLGSFPVVGGVATLDFQMPSGVPNGSVVSVRADVTGTGFEIPAGKAR